MALGQIKTKSFNTALNTILNDNKLKITIMKSITLLSLAFIMFAGNLFAGPKDEKKKTEAVAGAFAGGVVYSLPRTGIRLEVEVSQEKFFHGPYFEYAQKYLGIKGAPATDSENWTITGIKMETYGEPDPAEVHKAVGSVASMLSLSEEGVLVGINCEARKEKDKAYTSEFTKNVEIPRQIWPDLSMNSFLAGKDSTRRSGDKFKTFEEKAAEAAHDVLKLRKRKALALAAKYDKLPPDGEAYKVMVNELDRIIDDYTALFIGKSLKEKHSYTFEVVPDSKGAKGLVAFRFSSSTGVLPENNISGKPIMLELEPNADLVRNSSQFATPVTGETSVTGVFYRIPGFAVARVLNGTEVMAQARLPIAQFGVVSHLPDGILNGEYSIEFHPATGAIQRIGN
jgi:hypothetical protein